MEQTVVKTCSGFFPVFGHAKVVRIFKSPSTRQHLQTKNKVRVGDNNHICVTEDNLQKVRVKSKLPIFKISNPIPPPPHITWTRQCGRGSSAVRDESWTLPRHHIYVCTFTLRTCYVFKPLLDIREVNFLSNINYSVIFTESLLNVRGFTIKIWPPIIELVYYGFCMCVRFLRLLLGENRNPC